MIHLYFSKCFQVCISFLAYSV